MNGDDLAVGEELGNYRVQSRLGRGGMSVLYRATDTRLERPVALKVMASELAQDAKFRQRFISEARAAADVDHPNVIPIYDFGEIDGRLYIAMRLVTGRDMRRLLVDYPQLSAFRTLELLFPIADALDAIHAHGMVHRDVKPENVLLAVDPGGARSEHVYLSDFGLSKDATSNVLTEPGQMVGTVDYAAPEQLQGQPVDGRADQYSLACMVYECLSGQRPFQRDNPAAVVYAAVHEQPPTLTSRRGDLDEAIDEVMRIALAKDPRARFETCGELLHATAAALGIETGDERVVSNPTISGRRGRSTVISGPGARGATASGEGVVPIAINTDEHAAAEVPTPADVRVSSPGAPVSRPVPAGVGRSGARSRVVVASAAVIAALALIAGVFVLKGGGGKEKASGRTADTTAPTSGAPVVELTSSTPEGGFQGLVATRPWRADGTAFSSVTEVSNPTGGEVTADHIEVIPKGLAPSAASASYEPANVRVLQEDPIIAWTVKLQPGEKQTLTYRSTLPAPIAQSDLAAFETERAQNYRAVLAFISAQGSLDGFVPPVVSPPTGSNSSSGNGGNGGNGTGSSGSTQSSTQVTPTSPQITVPGAVTNVTVQNPSGDNNLVSVDLSWSAPSNTGGQITGYKIRWSQITTGVVSSGADQTTNTSKRVSTNGTNFGSSFVKWEVAAFNDAGTGPFVTAVGIVPDVINNTTFPFHLIRAIGGRASGRDPVDCGQPLYTACSITRTVGKPINAGDDVGIVLQLGS